MSDIFNRLNSTKKPQLLEIKQCFSDAQYMVKLPGESEFKSILFDEYKAIESENKKSEFCY